MAFFTDLTNALNATVVGTFGRDVLYTPQTGSPFIIRAIFESTRETEEKSPGVYAALFVQLSSLAAPPERGDEVTVDAVLYKVFDIEADTSGAAVLRLRLAS
jgi:hypothetical protein